MKKTALALILGCGVTSVFAGGHLDDKHQLHKPQYAVTLQQLDTYVSGIRRQAGVRIYGPNATVAQDLEPEYITTEGGQAYVTLQEANALAVIDIAKAKCSRSCRWATRTTCSPATASTPATATVPLPSPTGR